MRFDGDRLQDILEAIAKIYRHADRERDESDWDEMVQTWYLHHLIIGEAASVLSTDLRRHHTAVPWSAIIAMHNIIVHDDFGIDTTEIWNAVRRDVPHLKGHVGRLVERGLSE